MTQDEGELPLRLMGSWKEVPRAMKREIARQYLEKGLSLYGWPMILKPICAGREDMGMTLAQSWTAKPEQLYPVIRADTLARQRKPE